jgi:26S proteasome regulatory subunit N10
MSLDEERARQAAVTAAASASSSTPLAAVPELDALSTPIKKEAVIEDVGMGGDDEDDDLARALALSRGDDVEMGDGEEENEDDEIAKAIALSMKESEDSK